MNQFSSRNIRRRTNVIYSSRKRYIRKFQSIPFDCWCCIIEFLSSTPDLFSTLYTVKGLPDYLKRYPNCARHFEFIANEEELNNFPTSDEPHKRFNYVTCVKMRISKSNKKSSILNRLILSFPRLTKTIWECYYTAPLVERDNYGREFYGPVDTTSFNNIGLEEFVIRRKNKERSIITFGGINKIKRIGITTNGDVTFKKGCMKEIEEISIRCFTNRSFSLSVSIEDCIKTGVYFEPKNLRNLKILHVEGDFEFQTISDFEKLEVIKLSFMKVQRIRCLPSIKEIELSNGRDKNDEVIIWKVYPERLIVDSVSVFMIMDEFPQKIKTFGKLGGYYDDDDDEDEIYNYHMKPGINELVELTKLTYPMKFFQEETDANVKLLYFSHPKLEILKIHETRKIFFEECILFEGPRDLPELREFHCSKFLDPNGMENLPKLEFISGKIRRSEIIKFPSLRKADVCFTNTGNWNSRNLFLDADFWKSLPLLRDFSFSLCCCDSCFRPRMLGCSYSRSKFFVEGGTCKEEDNLEDEDSLFDSENIHNICNVSVLKIDMRFRIWKYEFSVKNLKNLESFSLHNMKLDKIRRYENKPSKTSKKMLKMVNRIRISTENLTSLKELSFFECNFKGYFSRILSVKGIVDRVITNHLAQSPPLKKLVIWNCEGVTIDIESWNGFWVSQLWIHNSKVKVQCPKSRSSFIKMEKLIVTGGKKSDLEFSIEGLYLISQTDALGNNLSTQPFFREIEVFSIERNVRFNFRGGLELGLVTSSFDLIQNTLNILIIGISEQNPELLVSQMPVLKNLQVLIPEKMNKNSNHLVFDFFDLPCLEIFSIQLLQSVYQEVDEKYFYNETEDILERYVKKLDNSIRLKEKKKKQFFSQENVVNWELQVKLSQIPNLRELTLPRLENTAILEGMESLVLLRIISNVRLDCLDLTRLRNRERCIVHFERCNVQRTLFPQGETHMFKFEVCPESARRMVQEK